METTFRIDYAHPADQSLEDYTTLFRRVGEMLCRECGGTCAEFFLAKDIDEYLSCSGPKIGWAIEGDTLLLLMANCKELNRMERISQFLSHFGMTVIDSRCIQ